MTIEMVKKNTLAVATFLKKNGLKLTTAESCTGGGLSYWITSVPGSSEWFERGFITYSNQAKVDMLGVNPETLRLFGAVSAEVAHEMAAGALRNSTADISIAITGIAGPDGGSEEKPVGTVWIGHAKRDSQPKANRYVFNGDRQNIRLQAIATALQQIIDCE